MPVNEPMRYRKRPVEIEAMLFAAGRSRTIATSTGKTVKKCCASSLGGCASCGSRSWDVQ